MAGNRNPTAVNALMRRPLQPLRHLPGRVGYELRPCTGLPRIGAGSVALEGTRKHAVQNRGDAEHAEHQVDLPILYCATARSPAVKLDVLLLRRDSERLQVVALQAAELRWGKAPRDHLVRKVGERVTERGELPIQHGQYP